MFLSNLIVALLGVVSVCAVDLLTDINIINRYWGQVSPYADNDENYFGVDYVGIPAGCQIVSSVVLQNRASIDSLRNKHIHSNVTQIDFRPAVTMMAEMMPASHRSSPILHPLRTHQEPSLAH